MPTAKDPVHTPYQRLRIREGAPVLKPALNFANFRPFGEINVTVCAHNLIQDKLSIRGALLIYVTTLPQRIATKRKQNAKRK